MLNPIKLFFAKQIKIHDILTERGLFMKKFFIAAIFILSTALPSFSGVDEVKQSIITQSKEMGVDPAIMLSLAKAESGFRQEARGGQAVGVFQLLPATAKFLGVNPYDMNDNVKGGIKYYKSMYNMFGTPELALAAYNSGAMAVKRCNCIPEKSRPFVNKVMADSKLYK